MKYYLSRSYTFPAAHQLQPEKIYGKCSNLHGHTYKTEITISSGHLNNDMVLNFYDVDNIVSPLIELLDHSFLNDILLERPTTENVCSWIFRELKDKFGSLVLEEVSVWESEKSKITLKNSL